MTTTEKDNKKRIEQNTKRCVKIEEMSSENQKRIIEIQSIFHRFIYVSTIYSDKYSKFPQMLALINRGTHQPIS